MTCEHSTYRALTREDKLGIIAALQYTIAGSGDIDGFSRLSEPLKVKARAVLAAISTFTQLMGNIGFSESDKETIVEVLLECDAWDEPTAGVLVAAAKDALSRFYGHCTPQERDSASCQLGSAMAALGEMRQNRKLPAKFKAWVFATQDILNAEGIGKEKK